MKRAWVGVLILTLGGCGSPAQKPHEGTREAGVLPSVEVDYIQKGKEHLRQSNVTAAIRNFDEAIKQSPQDLAGYLILGQTYMRLKDYTRAIDTFNAATRVAPDQGQVYLMLAISCSLAGKQDLAVVNAQKSIELFRQQKDEEGFRKAVLFLQGITQPAAPKTDG